MKVNEITCESWNEFKEKIMMDTLQLGKFVKGKYLFRGQGSSKWELQSSFDRLCIPSKDKKTISEQLYSNFKKECEQENLSDEFRSNYIWMLSLGQHFLLPTRLLDWSESPYVAAFFAFSSHIRQRINLEEYVAIWVINSEDYIWDEMHGCKIVNVPSFNNIRIYNQQGKFTLLNTSHNSINEYVESFNDDTIYLNKYIVPVKDARFAMSDLHAMGLDHSRIYPGLEGKAIAALVKLHLENDL